jgi:hypothetical protein
MSRDDFLADFNKSYNWEKDEDQGIPSVLAGPHVLDINRAALLPLKARYGTPAGNRP